MTESYNTCPCGCGQRQDAGLLSASCTDRLERELGDVRAVVDELAVTVSKQARVGQAGKPGLASERSPVNFGAITVADNLTNVLTTWARDVSGDPATIGATGRPPAVQAAWILLAQIDAVRRHPEVAAMVDEIGDAISQARQIVDRPADRVYVGPCRQVAEREFGQMIDCGDELWARPNSATVQCRTCGENTDVTEQRTWMLDQAADMLTSAKEASRYIGQVGHIDVTEASIRGLIHRKKLGYRDPVDAKRFRLGDLLIVLADMRAQKALEEAA